MRMTRALFGASAPGCPRGSRTFFQRASCVVSDPNAAADLATDTVERLRDAWQREIRDEAANRFPALAEHYEWRISNLPICQP